MEFINVSHPSRSTSLELRRRANSHAARVAHARARRLRNASHNTNKKANAEHIPSQHSSTSRLPVALVVDREKDADEISSPSCILTSNRRDLLASFARKLTPMEDYLLDHYAGVVAPYLHAHCPVNKGPSKYRAQQILSEWLNIALTDVDFLSYIFLASCRHLTVHHQYSERFAKMATQYKLVCLRKINEAISMEAPIMSDLTVARAMALALDEVMIRDFTTCKQHIRGVLKMVELRGGPETLGLNGFLAYLLDKFLREKRILDEEPAQMCGESFMVVTAAA